MSLRSGRVFHVNEPLLTFNSERGTALDLFRSVRPSNVGPMLSVSRHNADLIKYLIGQVLQSSHHRFAALQEFYPRANPEDWRPGVAGHGVQNIKGGPRRGGG